MVATRVPVLAIHQDREPALTALVEAGRALLELGADSIVLGCAGFDRRLEDLLGVRKNWTRWPRGGATHA